MPLSRRNPKPLPCILLVPALDTTLIVPPVPRPYSALNGLVTTSNSRIESTPRAVPATLAGPLPRTDVVTVPSSRNVVAVGRAPATVRCVPVSPKEVPLAVRAAIVPACNSDRSM